MKHVGKKMTALFLALALLFSMIPNTVYAEETAEEAQEVVSSLYLPIVAEGEEAISFFNNGATYFYASTNATAVSVDGIPNPAESGYSGQEARIQAVKDGRVVAQTAAFTNYSNSTISGTLNFFEQPVIGEYQLQMVCGDAESLQTFELADHYLSVVGAPVITNAYINNLYAGTTPFELTLYVSGYQGTPDIYTFSLMNSEGENIACTTEYKSVSDSGSKVALTYLVTPSQTLAEEQYYLTISSTQVTLYSNATSVSAYVYGDAPEDVTIAEVTANDAVLGGVNIVLENATEGAIYNVKAELSSYNVEASLFEGELVPVMDGTKGTFSIVLQYNGVTLPVYSYEQTIQVTVTSSDGRSSSTYSCDFSEANVSVSSYASVTKVGQYQYDFSLTGYNMLLDLYENASNTFELKDGDTSLATCTDITKSVEESGSSTEYHFEGSFITSTELEIDSDLKFYINDEFHTWVWVKAPSVETETTELSAYATSNEMGYSSFYFNFDYIPVQAVARNGEATASLELYDVTAGQVVATTGEVTGTNVEDGYQFDFLLAKPTDFDASGNYCFVMKSGEKECNVRSNLMFDSELEFGYYSVVTPVFMGDTELVVEMSSYSVKNISAEYLMENPFSFYHVGAETEVEYTFGTPYYSFDERCWIVPLELAEPLAYGKYEYDSYSSFTTQLKDTPLLGSVSEDNTSHTILIQDNYYLPDAAYTGIIYSAGEQEEKVAEIALNKTVEDVLVGAEPAGGLVNGYYVIEVLADGVYIGAESFYINWNDESVAKPSIKGYYYDTDNTYQKIEIVYEVPTEQIMLEMIYSGYAYVRYAEEANFEGTEYSAIRTNQTLQLSEGEGEKVICVQFKKTSGEESAVYRWVCKRVTQMVTPEILSATVLVDGASSLFVPESTEFVLRLVTNSALTGASVKFLYEDGSTYYYTEYLEYVGSTQEGIVYELTMNSNDYMFYSVDLFGARFSLYDINGDSIYTTIDVPVLIGVDGLYLTAWGSGNYVYTNQTTYSVSGYTAAYETVTVTVGGESQEVYASANGAFSATFSGLEEGTKSVAVSDSENSESKTLVVDTTAPVITKFAAALGTGGNAAISWTCTEENIESYILWRDGVKVLAEDDYFTDTSYIAANAVDCTFELVAVDKAGNRSEKVQTSTKDTEKPTVPGVPTITGHGTKSVTFTWDAATDNVAVYQYEVYRGDTKIATLSYGTRSYTDSGLEEGTEYTYQVFALDRAGNKSDAATATIATAELKISYTKTFEEQYFLEAYADTKTLPIHLVMITDPYYDFSKATVKFLYKLSDAESWTETILSGTNTYREGTWNIYGLEEGTYQVKFGISDTEGTEVFSEVQTAKILHDNIAPEIGISVPEEGKTYGGKELVVSGGATDNLILNTVELYYSVEEGANYIRIASESNTDADGSLSVQIPFEVAKELSSGAVWIKAVATDIAGNSNSVVRKFVLDNTPPTKPGDFWVGGDKEKITVSWTYPELQEGNDFSHFNVYRSTTGESDDFVIVESIGSIGYFDTLETGILAETLYYYYVTAEDTYGNESDATLVQSAQLIDDTESPMIRGINPEDGTLIKSVELVVSATDNYRLDKCVIEYKKDEDSTWQSLAEVGCGDTPVRSYVYHYTWNLESLDAGNYQVRYTVYDEQENEPTSLVKEYVVEAYTAPVAPVANAQSTEHKEITISWTYSGNRELAKTFSVYRSEDGTSYEYIGAVSVDSTWSYVDKLRFEQESKEFFYKVVVADDFSQTKESNVVSAVAATADQEKPNAVINTNCSSYESVGKEIAFSAAASTDNDIIVAYRWAFGDGETATGVNVTHAYAEPGTYEVQLTVEDASGNQGTSCETITVITTEEQEIFTRLEIAVQNTFDTSPILNADVILRSEEDTFETMLRVDERTGEISCLIPNGIYTVSVAADGYLTRTVTIYCFGDTKHTIGLRNANIMTGEFTTTEMTYDEIVAAGIDVNAEGNQHVYKFTTELTFVVGLKTYSLPLTLYKNNNGEIVKKTGGGNHSLPGGEGSDSVSGDVRIGIDFSEHFVLVIYGEAHWLKEMYNAELTVMNNSYTDTLEHVVAELELPEGLSLAELNVGNQNLIQEIGTIGYGESRKVNWYIRGDKEGEYHLCAKVRAVSMPYGDVIEQWFNTSEPLKVYAGNALHLTVTADDMATRGGNYNVKFRLENVSDKSLYNLSFGITGSEQYKVLEWAEDKASVLPIESTQYGDQFIREVRELAPGGYIELAFSTTAWFNSALELVDLTQLGAFVDLSYYLTDVKIIEMEGSTTTIPHTININRVERESIIDKVLNETVSKVYKEFFDKKIPGGNLFDLVEVMLKDTDLDVPMLKKAKTIFKLAKGETDHKMYISIDNGKSDGNSIYNDYVSITTGSGVEGFIDTVNNTKLTIKATELSVQAKGPGSTVIKIGVENSLGNMEKEYSLKLNIDDREVSYTSTVSPGYMENSYQVDEEKWKETLEILRENELGELERNPWLTFDSELEWTLTGATSNSNFSFTISDKMVEDLIEKTGTTHMEVNGAVADIEFNREALKEIAQMANSDITLVARRLSDGEAAEIGSTKPTYQFEMVYGDKKISNFGQGAVYVEIPYALSDTESANDLYVEHILPDGTSERLDAEYDVESQTICFNTDGFSYFRIVSGAATDDSEDNENGSQGGSTGGNSGSGSLGGGNSGGGYNPGGTYDDGITEENPTDSKEEENPSENPEDKEDSEDGEEKTDDKPDADDSEEGKEDDASTDNSDDDKKQEEGKETDIPVLALSGDGVSELDITLDDVASKLKDKYAYLFRYNEEKKTYEYVGVAKADEQERLLADINEEEYVVIVGGELKETEEVTYQQYVVKHGDTLWKIAQEYLGVGGRYKEIIELNDLRSPVLYSGMILKLPVSADVSQTTGQQESDVSNVKYVIHVVKHGDTMWKIAEKYLGMGSRYKEIMKLNNMTSTMLFSGMKLKIPTIVTEESDSVAETKDITIEELIRRLNGWRSEEQKDEQPENKNDNSRPDINVNTEEKKKVVKYTVKSGDYLRKIAKEQLGDGNRWGEIRDLNKNITNVNLIYPGQVLILPER